MMTEMVDVTNAPRPTPAPRRTSDPTAYGPHAGLEDVVLPSNYFTVADRLEGAAERRQRDTAALLRPDGSRLYSDEEHAARQREIDERWAAAAGEAQDFLQHVADEVDAEEQAQGGDGLADTVQWEHPWVASFLQVATREVDALPWPALLARLRRLAHDAEALGEVATVLQDLERRYGQAEARKEELGRRRRELLALRRRVHAARTAGEGGQEAIQARLLAGGGYTRF